MEPRRRPRGSVLFVHRVKGRDRRLWRRDLSGHARRRPLLARDTQWRGARNGACSDARLEALPRQPGRPRRCRTMPQRRGAVRGPADARRIDGSRPSPRPALRWRPLPPRSKAPLDSRGSGAHESHVHGWDLGQRDRPRVWGYAGFHRASVRAGLGFQRADRHPRNLRTATRGAERTGGWAQESSLLVLFRPCLLFLRGRLREGACHPSHDLCGLVVFEMPDVTQDDPGLDSHDQ